MNTQDMPLGGQVVATSAHEIPLGVIAWLHESIERRNFVFAVKPDCRIAQRVAAELGEYLPKAPLRQRNWVLEKAVEWRLLDERGFKVGDRGSIYEIPYERSEARLLRMGNLLDAKRSLKAGQTVTPWDSKWNQEVRRVTLASKLADGSTLDALLSAGRPQSLCPAASQIAIEDGALVGFIMASVRGDCCELPVRWVAPSHRNTWVNARLLLHSLRNGRSRHQGVLRLRFRGDESAHRETHQLAQRFGGSLYQRSVRLERIEGAMAES